MTISQEASGVKRSESALIHKVTLGPVLLAALVIGSMVGSGVFSLPQNMAASAGANAILIGWIITAVGIGALAIVYRNLAVRVPKLDSGPYAYAKAGFGDFIGFNSAWGYWLSAWLGNVSYAVVLFGALSFFYAGFGEGNTWQAILGASVVLWFVHFLILGGNPRSGHSEHGDDDRKDRPRPCFHCHRGGGIRRPYLQRRGCASR